MTTCLPSLSATRVTTLCLKQQIFCAVYLFVAVPSLEMFTAQLLSLSVYSG